MTVAIKEIEAERAAAQSPYDEELGMLGTAAHQTQSPDTAYHGGGGGAGYQSSGETAYQGVGAAAPYPYEGAPGRAM